MRRNVKQLWLVLAGAVVACSSSGSNHSGSGPVTIAFITKLASNTAFDPARAGADDAANYLSQQYNRKVTIEHLDPPGTIPSNDVETTMLDEIVTGGAGVDGGAPITKAAGACISCVDAINIDPAINSAAAAGVPVITYDADAPASNRVAYVNQDDKAGGATAFDLLSKLLNGTGNVAILAGKEASANIENRKQGFLDELQRVQNGISVVTQFHCQEDNMQCACMTEVAMNGKDPNSCDNMNSLPPETSTCADAAFQAYLATCMTPIPVPVGWYFAGGWAFYKTPPMAAAGDPQPVTSMPTWEAAASASPQIMKSVAFNYTSFTTKALSANLLNALVGQRSYQWGYKSVKAMGDLLLGGVTPQGFIDTGVDEICPNNVQMALDILSTKAWSTTLPACTILSQ
jgi:ribose transport system substrate-binding protein